MADVVHEEWAAAASAAPPAAAAAAAAAATAEQTDTVLVLHPNIGGSQSASHLSNAVPLVQRRGLSTLRGGSYDAAALEELALQAFHYEGGMRTFCVLLQAVALVHAWHLRSGRVPAECHQAAREHGQCAVSHLLLLDLRRLESGPLLTLVIACLLQCVRSTCVNHMPASSRCQLLVLWLRPLLSF